MKQHFNPSTLREFFSLRTNNNLLFKSNGIEVNECVLATLIYSPMPDHYQKVSSEGLGYIRTVSDGDSPRHELIKHKLDRQLGEYIDSLRQPLIYYGNNVYMVPLIDIAEAYDGFQYRDGSMQPQVAEAFEWVKNMLSDHKVGIYGAFSAGLQSVDGSFNDLDILLEGQDSMQSIESLVSSYADLENDIAARVFYSQNILNMERSYRTWRISVSRYKDVPIDLRICRTFAEIQTRCNKLNSFSEGALIPQPICGWFVATDIQASLTSYPQYLLADSEGHIYSITVLDYYPGVLKVGESVYVRGDRVEREIIVAPRYKNHCFIW